MLVKILLVTLVSCSVAFAAVPGITKCSINDAKCIKSSAQAFLKTFAAGLPQYGVDQLEPLHMKYLNASSPALTLVLNDLTAKGLDQCQVKKMAFDKDQSKLLVKLDCTVDIVGQYLMDGQLSFLKIQGNGAAHVVLRKAILSAEADIAEVTGKDGLPHWAIKRYSHSYELKDKATIELENLFNGNEELGRVAKELFATSPNDVVAEVGPPIIAAVVDKIVVTVNRFFKRVPLSDLVL